VKKNIHAAVNSSTEDELVARRLYNLLLHEYKGTGAFVEDIVLVDNDDYSDQSAVRDAQGQPEADSSYQILQDYDKPEDVVQI